MKTKPKSLKTYPLLRSALFACLACALSAGTRAGAQPANVPGDRGTAASTPAAHYWKSVAPGEAEAVQQRLKLRPGKGHVLSLDAPALERALAHCPREFTAEARSRPVPVPLPMPDGSFQRFAVVESPVMAPELAAKFPQIKTYCGQGLDDPTATVRFSVSPRGLQAQTLTTGGAVYLEPSGDEQASLYVSFDGAAVAEPASGFSCLTPTVADLSPLPPKPASRETPQNDPPPPPPAVEEADLSTGPELRVYRLAVATAGEWTALHGGTVPNAMAAVVTIVNQLNGYYEREFAIRFQLVANNDLLIYTDPTIDPYTAFQIQDSLTLLIQNQAVLDALIGPANYDLGTVLFVGTFGVAHLGVVCKEGWKGRSAVGFQIQNDGWSSPHVVAHEFGHLFNSDHTWTAQSCPQDQFLGAAAYEPGAGSTIMSYAGSCDAQDNFQFYGDDYFHAGSYDFIVSNITYGVSSTCPVLVPTGNQPPIVNAGGDFTIPSRTPFTLTAIGSDPDGDALTYCWEQHDLGPQSPLNATDNGVGPLFRSFPPSPNPARTFPQWSDILNNRQAPAEKLPRTSRTMRFRVTARDNRAGGGGVSRADALLTVVSNAGPFVVSAPASNAVWSGTQTVVWDVAGTTNFPINASTVNILLSTNGGLSFPITLAANTPNDGSELVALPDCYSSQARLKVEAVNNVFFAVSPGNFSLLPVGPQFTLSSSMLVSEDCTPTNGAVDAGETVTTAFVLKNVGLSAAADMVVALLAGNGVTAPSSEQTNILVPAGGLVTNVFSFTTDAGAACGGTITAQLLVSSAGIGLGTLDVPLAVGRRILTSVSFTNGGSFAFGDGGPAVGNVYPSFVNVSNVAGTISKLTARLTGLNHSWTPDLDVLLVGPQGQSVVLMSDAGRSGVSSVSLVFDDEAMASLPSGSAIVSGTYKPTNIPYPDFYYSPAPLEPYADALSVFNGTNPNGAWKLFVMDDTQGNFGSLFRWALTITAETTNCCAANDLLALSVADAADPVLVGGTVTYSVTVTNLSATEAHQVIVTNLLPSALGDIAFALGQGAGTLTNDQLVWDVGTLAPGTAASAMLSGTPPATGVLTLRANVTSSDPDGNGLNDVAEESTAVSQVAVFIADGAVTETNTGTKAVTVQLRLSQPASQTVSVDVATVDGTALAGSDYTAASGTMVFSPGQTYKPVTISTLGDTLWESNEVFYVQLSNPTNAIISGAQATITIVDNDQFRLDVNSPSVTEGNSGAKNLVFTVSLSDSNPEPVSVHYATVDFRATAGEDYLPVSGDLLFAPGERTKTVPVSVLGDTLSETYTDVILGTATLLNEKIGLRLSQPTNAVLGLAVGFGTIIDDDPLPRVNIADATVTEGDGGTTNANFTVTLSALRGWPTKVNYTTVNQTAVAGTDFIATNGTLTFPAGISNLTIVVPVLGNLTPNLDKSFLVRLSSPVDAVLGTSQAIGTIVDDDTLLISVAEFNGEDFRVGFRSKLGRNYRVEWTDTLGSGNWSAVTGADLIPGTGGTVLVLDLGARPHPQRFYRVQEVP